MMELRQLKAMTAIKDHGSFTAAADALDTVQSNISAHIARLERELKSVLIDRSTGQLTPAGEIVVIRARQIFDQLSSLETDISALDDRVQGIVKIGLIGTTARWLVPILFDLVPKKWPQLKPTYTEGTSISLEQEVTHGNLDLAIVNLPSTSAELVAAPMFEEDLVVIVGQDHPLANKNEISLAELSQINLILPAIGTAFRSELERAAKRAGITLKIQAEIDSIRLIASLTLGGCGPAILPSTAVPFYLQNEWKSVKITDLPPRLVGIVRSRQATQVPAVTAILNILDDSLTIGSKLPRGINVSKPGPSSLQSGYRSKRRSIDYDDDIPAE